MHALKLKEDMGGKLVDEESVTSRSSGGNQGKNSQASNNTSKEEFVVKEIEYGTTSNGLDGKRKNDAFVEEKNRVGEPIGTRGENYTLFNNSEETVVDLYTRKFSSRNRSADLYQNDVDTRVNDLKEYKVSFQSKVHPSELSHTDRVSVRVGVGIDSSGDRKDSIGLGSTIEPKEFNGQRQVSSAVSRDDLMDRPRSRNGELKYSSAELWKDCSVKTVFPFSKLDSSTSYDINCGIGEKEDGIRRPDGSIRTAAKEQVDEVGKALYHPTTQGNNELKTFGGLGFPVFFEKQKEEFPQLPPVKLKSVDKSSSASWEEKYQHDGPGSKMVNADSPYLIGSFLDVPFDQEIGSADPIIFTFVYLISKFL